jgi:predicted house-cleaning noncanonical NTP pyrophosphatase (MazG superfamily)
LWGLPEGLYWYSHDTLEVDVETGRFVERLRYKGTFVAPDSEGRWVPTPTLAPYDWRRSVKREAWIREIAKTTRSVADREEFPVSVMWFIDNDRRATSHQVLPWFHSKSDIGGPPKAAPRKKLTTARDYKIENREDWQRLSTLVAAGRHIERVVVAPTDPDLVRDQQFAEELAKLTARNQIVVELAGGVLSHAYYVLGRHGARVECVDLFGADSEVREFNKLVRDKIPESIQQRGEGAEVVELRGDALVAALKQKIVEEAYEALDARGGDELLGELADVQEVVRALCDALAIPVSQVDEERENKRLKRGGFKRGLMLKKTSTPHTLSADEETLTDLTLRDESADLAPAPIERPEEIPINSPYRRPDLRTVGELTEKLFTFETELSRTTDRAIRHNTRFVMPIDAGGAREFTLTLEFSRQRGVLRGTIRLRPEPQQLPMDLQDQLQLDFKPTDET